MAKAYSYLRFSTPEQMKGDSFRRQTSEAQKYAKEKGLTLDDELTFNDLGVSAFRGKNAAEGRLADFRKAIDAGHVEPGSYLLVENLDRISRQTARKALRVLEDIVESGVIVVTLNDKREYTPEALDDPFGLMASIFIFARSNEESARKSDRVRAAYKAKRDKAASGVPMRAKGPWWLTLNKTTRQWETNKPHAKVILWCVQKVLSGSSVAGLAKELNRSGELRPPRGGANWDPWTLRHWLTSPAIIGHHTPQTVDWSSGKRKVINLDPIPGYYPPLIDQDTYEQLKVRLKTSKRTYVTTQNGHLFQGLCICAGCGAPMHFKTGHGNHPHVLICAAAKNALGICRWRSVRYDALEHSFLESVEGILAAVPAGAEDIDAEVEKDRSNLDANQEAIERTLRRLEKTDSDSLLARLKELEAEREELKEKLRGSEERQASASGKLVALRVRELRAALKADPMDRKVLNAALRQVFGEVLVDPEKGTAEFRWRHGGSHPVWFPVPKRGRPQKDAV